MLIHSSWKNEFHHWLDGLEPKIRIYLFDSKEDRKELLRHVRFLQPFDRIFRHANLF